jgi:hypothetical protein
VELAELLREPRQLIPRQIERPVNGEFPYEAREGHQALVPEIPADIELFLEQCGLCLEQYGLFLGLVPEIPAAQEHRAVAWV